MEMLINGKPSLNSLVGMGSKRHVDDLDDAIVNGSLKGPTGQKQPR